MCKTCRYLLPCGAIQYYHTISCFDRNCTDLTTTLEDVTLTGGCETWKAHTCLNNAWEDLILGYAEHETNKEVELHHEEKGERREVEVKERGEKEHIEEARWLSIVLSRRYHAGGQYRWNLAGGSRFNVSAVIKSTVEKDQGKVDSVYLSHSPSHLRTLISVQFLYCPLSRQAPTSTCRCPRRSDRWRLQPNRYELLEAAPSGAKVVVFSFDTTAMLTVRVGGESNQKDFVVHESFLTARSEFFRRAMNGSWEEAESRVVKLPQDEPEIFALYLNHVYTGRLPSISKTEEELSALAIGEFRTITTAEYDEMVGLFILADKFQDVASKNAAITSIFEISLHIRSDGKFKIPSPAQVRIMYRHTSEGANIRRLVVDLWSSMSPEHIFEYASRLPQDFLRDLAVALRRDRKHADNTARANGAKSYIETPQESQSAPEPASS
ncbi:hypothetical protein P153DRAFT_431113 [Dothidotthia symphoricarpi CBS 119687]|uniref:BTB domain-containing protein n=1 Tax=Dothidotthia symphoricarpi CBS 119687 TaxID=1392245 RepID=A0A6A6AE29_9PLEO|nr:uncharacterized protein P153DRAFT_431113 [Dothidotthia symphoricarpi CBS 119687]KAF2130050.1 hypothetical protein P153DRAFT_431113 [Dothidotthia symphoricarpi CBS 119687]